MVRQYNSFPNIMALISPTTLQAVSSITLYIKGWEWTCALRELIRTLAAGHRLQSMHIIYHDRLKGMIMRDCKLKYPDNGVHGHLCQLATIRGVPQVTFAGDLPTVYTSPLSFIMSLPPGIMQGLPVLQAVRGDGTIVQAG